MPIKFWFYFLFFFFAFFLASISLYAFNLTTDLVLVRLGEGLFFFLNHYLTLLAHHDFICSLRIHFSYIQGITTALLHAEKQSPPSLKGPQGGWRFQYPSDGKKVLNGRVARAA